MQASNVLGALTVTAPADGLPRGPVLLVDDTTGSGWTLTVAADALLAAGADRVLPLVLWQRP